MRVFVAEKVSLLGFLFGGGAGRANEKFAAEDAAFFHDDGLRVQGTFEHPALEDFHLAIAMHERGDFSADLDGVRLHGPHELALRALFDDETPGLDGTEDAFPGANTHLMRGEEGAAQLAFDDGGMAGDFGARDFSLGEDDDLALGLDGAAKGAGDFEIAQVDVAPALRAEAGLRGAGDRLVMAAGKAGDVANALANDEFGELFEQGWPFEARGFFREDFLDAVVLAALSAEGGLRVGGFQLGESTVRTIRTDFLSLPGLVWLGHVGPVNLPAVGAVSVPRRRAAVFGHRPDSSPEAA